MTQATDLEITDRANGQAVIPGAGRRMTAYFIDFLLVGLVGFATHMAFLFSITGTSVASSFANIPTLAVFCYAVNLIYHAMMDSHPRLRATVGKIVMGLQIVDFQAQTITRKVAFYRGLARLPSIAALGLPYLSAIQGTLGLTLHDKMAGTVVTVRSLPSDRVISGLRAGRQRTIGDVVVMAAGALMLVYIDLTIGLGFISLL